MNCIFIRLKTSLSKLRNFPATISSQKFRQINFFFFTKINVNWFDEKNFALQLKIYSNFENISWKQHSVPWFHGFYLLEYGDRKLLQFVQCEGFRLISHYSRASSNQIAKYPQQWLPHSVTEKYRKVMPRVLFFVWLINISILQLAWPFYYPSVFMLEKRFL